MPLTVAKLRTIKSTGKIERFYDEKGLYLEVTKAGGKYWRFKYAFGGKESRLTIGPWPDVSLDEAREARDEYRKSLRAGVPPSDYKNTPKADSITFKSVAEDWRANMGNIWSDSHAKTTLGRLELDVYPVLGDKALESITPHDVLPMLRSIEARGAYETAQRVLGICSMIFRYGVATKIILSDPCRDLRDALVPYTSKHFAAITRPAEVGRLLLTIDEYKGSAIVRAALVFSALTFCRPGEIRHAEWDEIDWKEKEWLLPAEKTKLRREHIVPLSRQAIEVLEGIRALTGRGRYVFPGQHNKTRPLSENGVNCALRRMGYTSDEMTAHGFRSMASTLLNEQGCWRFDVIERQLAHVEKSSVRGAYNRAEYLPERRQMMQAWADYLDELRALASGE
ncbi:tyrosine-type recombinase/integrase [Desulfovibrio intestinalis]|uniref:Integrase n=1 Tax=Desulfovibrio intestinalis TaxID=58621 RepID=A0A7W8C2Y5_9BACT|nr:integrase arm-type DNA-binding domain-containing protein [Desulfovibrio intestinalis]MBB5143908.1 integrase [Desulfovibrio intestinalis]